MYKRFAYMRSVFAALCTFLMCITASAVWAQITFEDVDLNGADGLLFSVRMQNGNRLRKNLYLAELDPHAQNDYAALNEPRLLTCFPQKLETLQNGKFLQIRNADGVFIYGLNTQTLSCVSPICSLYPSPALHARVRDNLVETAVSPDGNWICLFKKKDAVSGSIVLASTKTGKERVLVEKADFSFTDIPVLWAPDSAFLIYEKNKRLYFIAPDDAFDPALADEKYRSIGEGGISRVAWAGAKKLMYIQGDLIFALNTHELYTRALYAAVLGTGTIALRLPWFFDDQRDRFWTDVSGTKAVLVQGGKSVFYIDLGKKSHFYTTAFLPVPEATSAVTVLWAGTRQKPGSSAQKRAAGTYPIVWFEYFTNGGKRHSAAYALQKSAEPSPRLSDVRFVRLSLPEGAENPALSPDKKKIAFCADNALHVYDVDTWLPHSVYTDEKIVSFAWRNTSSLYIGGSETVSLKDIDTGTEKLLFLSAADGFAWDSTGTRIFASIKKGIFAYDSKTNTWTNAPDTVQRKRRHMNAQWRIILDRRPAGFYKNLLFVRSLQGPGKNRPLLPALSGVKNNTKGKVAVAFDALDNAEDIPHILNMLAERGIKTTFFINGEFMRRFPEAVKTLCAQEYECASLFHTVADLLSDDFVIDENFIRRGLARNEDEFYALTGTDMKLFWHAPYGRYSELIEKAGKAAGYTIIKNAVYVNSEPLSSERIAGIGAKLHDGAVILVPCAVAASPRNNPSVIGKLEVLINAVLEAGYEIVPVSQIIY